MKYSSLAEYIDSVRADTNLSIQAARIIPPIGPAADRYLWNAISECCETRNHIVSFTAPCIRRERRENIQRGSHLSLFFLMMIVLGEDVLQSRINQIYAAITGVTEISVIVQISVAINLYFGKNLSQRQKTLIAQDTHTKCLIKKKLKFVISRVLH